MERGDKDNGTEESDQKAFNEALKRMLATPPKPHEKPAKPKPKKEKPAK